MWQLQSIEDSHSQHGTRDFIHWAREKDSSRTNPDWLMHVLWEQKLSSIRSRKIQNTLTSHDQCQSLNSYTRSKRSVAVGLGYVPKCNSEDDFHTANIYMIEQMEVKAAPSETL